MIMKEGMVLRIRCILYSRTTVPNIGCIVLFIALDGVCQS